jgi:hypothetical protein
MRLGQHKKESRVRESEKTHPARHTGNENRSRRQVSYVAPIPRSPASLGGEKKTQTTASVPIENCLIRGMHSEKLGTT